MLGHAIFQIQVKSPSTPYALQLYYRRSLEKLLSALCILCDTYRFHVAGNGAYFALKGLLLIAAHDMDAYSQTFVSG